MVIHAKSDKGIKANTVLFDAWCASVGNLKVLHRLGLDFVTTLKSNRLVSVSKDQHKESGYVHVDTLAWDEDTLKHGCLVKLKELPFLVRLFKSSYFKIVAPNGDIEWVITNRGLDEDTDDGSHARFRSDDVQKENAVRWQIEQLHRELKQLVGTEKCQCREVPVPQGALSAQCAI